MKKINLSIPKPCHENWNNMPSVDKGRFCASCQKTVMDFTGMSDRQLAAFFKKPAGSVCGRFQQDQLNRDIEIPRKRIPWIKYFFRFSLPAFLISMKAGAQIGKVAVKGDTIVQPVKVVDSKVKVQSIPTKKPEKNKKTLPLKRTSMIESVNLLKFERVDSSKLTDLKFEFVRRPEITCQALQGIAGGVVVVVGGVSLKRKFTQNTKPVSEVSKILDTAIKKINTTFKNFSVYPNPVQSNSTMKIDLKKMQKGNYTISILNMAGEVIQSEEISVENKNQPISLHLNETAAGTYFIHVFNRKTAASCSEKIVVQ